MIPPKTKKKYFFGHDEFKKYIERHKVAGCVDDDGKPVKFWEFVEMVLAKYPDDKNPGIKLICKMFPWEYHPHIENIILERLKNIDKK